VEATDKQSARGLAHGQARHHNYRRLRGLVLQFSLARSARLIFIVSDDVVSGIGVPSIATQTGVKSPCHSLTPQEGFCGEESSGIMPGPTMNLFSQEDQDVSQSTRSAFPDLGICLERG
jgi:hypothetical protein